MPAEQSLQDFTDLVLKSRLLDQGQLDRALASRAKPGASKAPPPPTAREFADQLVRSGDLTHFQAAKLLHGRWAGLALGPYRILAPLGRGGMGTVYLARDSRLAEELGDQVLVALKILPPRIAREQERMLMRFQREINMGKRVGHANVTRTLAGGEIDGVNYIAMEYVPGRSLQRMVGLGGRIAVGDAARIFADVATGLHHLHERKIIHRDLKPANVMVMPAGGAKILDLGLAIALGEPLPADPRIIGGKGYILGTMDYIAPEQARNATDVGPHTDLYSLGCAIYFALSGTPPFPGGTSKDKIRRQRTLDPAPLSDMNPAVSPKLAKLVSRFMAKQPSDRPATALEARELLLPFATQQAGIPALSIRDAVGAVDSPDVYPELWTDDSDSEGRATHEPHSAGSLPLLYIPPDPEPPSRRISIKTWVLIGGGVFWIVLIILLLIVFLR
jgi:eukaryotic-like serine/threonine-protein kinase